MMFTLLNIFVPPSACQVFESLPETLQECFKTGDVEMLKQALLSGTGLFPMLLF